MAMSNSSNSPVDSPESAAQYRGAAMTEYEYDELGRLAGVIVTGGSNDRPRADEQHPGTGKFECQYDALGRVTRIVKSDSN
jgi:hypothetical protein